MTPLWWESPLERYRRTACTSEYRTARILNLWRCVYSIFLAPVLQDVTSGYIWRLIGHAIFGVLSRYFNEYLTGSRPLYALSEGRDYASVIQCLRNTGISLPWLDGRSIIPRIVRNSYNFLAFSVITYHLVIAACSAIILPDFDDKCRAGAVLSIVSNPTMLFVYYTFYQKRIKRFLEHSDELSKQILDSGLGHAEYFKKIYLKSARKNNMLTIIVLALVFLTPVCYNIPRPIIDHYNHEYRKTQPLFLYYPFDVHQPGGYELTFILQTLGLLFADTKKFASDCFFLTLFRTQTLYLKYLSASIRELGEEFKKSGDSVLKKEMIKWIELHDYFMRNTTELISLYTPVICINKGNLICIVVLCIFSQLQETRYGLIEGMAMAGFFLINIFQLYMQCATNDDLSVEADNHALEIYKMPWYDIDKTNKDILRTVFLMASRPVEITAFKSPILRLNKEAFLSFVASTITAVMTVKQMSDLHK